ncbi:MAG: hypothetical protein ACJ74X_09065 [Gaiellaceae bacterium]
MFRSLALSAVLLAALAAGAPAADREPQHLLFGWSHGRGVQASLGSHCTPSHGSMACADSEYPLATERRLPVHGRGRIRLEFGAEPQEIYPDLRDHRSRSLRELTPRGDGTEWRVRLPRVLPRGMDRLGVFVTYRRGSADFEIDLRRHRHR